MAIMDRSMEGKRQYTTGISKGVFFGEDGKAFPWNGLISVTEKPQANAPTPVYNSLGEKYDQFGNIAEKKHSLTCYTYPEEMDEFLGIEYLEEMGYSVDERPPKKFSMAYRTEVGDGLYEIHVLLNQIATFADTAKNTITNNITPTVVTMNLEGVPDPRIKTSHIILDSRLPLTASAERLLFGNNMVDGNINEFLDAEPTWVTVATNYAPIIEPDYDNMVWLGGRNLFSTANYSHHSNVGYSNNGTVTSAVIEVEPFTTYTISIKNKQTNRLGIYQDPLVDGIHSGYVDKTVLSTPEFLNTTKGSDYVRTVTTTDNGRYMILYLSNEGGSEHSDLIKVELGSTSTPWTPAPEDNYVPPSDQPRPANYVPGVKGGSWWDARSNGTRASLSFYDEQTKRLGLYSLTPPDGPLPYLIIALNDPNGSHMGVGRRFYIETHVDTPIDPGPRPLVVRVENPIASNVIPNTTGDYITDMGHISSGINVNMRLYHPGPIDSGIITFSELMYTSDNYKGAFFDVYTKPKTKGDRYVRMSRYTGDYTEHQQLMLQSKSRVILSDITPNQYTLEASDSQLRVDGQTFTFEGPQATPVGDDQFTINDEIYGED